MPAFKQVFSTTAKTVISLVIISLGIGIVWAIISAASERRDSSSSAERFEDSHTDEASNEMPKSQWNAKVNAAIAAHCIFEGMSKSQVEQALGKLTHNGAFEVYEVQNGSCRKYNGDACIEFDSDRMYLDFTKAGNFKDSTFMSSYRFASASSEGKPIVCWAPSWTKEVPGAKPATKIQNARVRASTSSAK